VQGRGGVAGNTTRVLVPLADGVMVGRAGPHQRPVAQKWANALPKPRRIAWLGTPVREDITRIVPPRERYAARAGRLRLLVVGGSLGAQTLNDLVVAALAAMPPEARPEVVHQSGEKLYNGLRGAYAQARLQAEIVPFISDMAARYAWCDVLVCRSGAITVAEITAAGVAAILFPLPWFVADEQKANAAFLADRGAGIAMAQLETQPTQLAQVLASLTREGLAAMASSARALGKPDATQRCADLCAELAHAA
jgi:UDP-N-acetylglucosamine--N-acetylmuramyl-(pentapeptide) pyrophosphoryl-undecaprenol N-acetylglucosamine transferase